MLVALRKKSCMVWQLALVTLTLAETNTLPFSLGFMPGKCRVILPYPAVPFAVLVKIFPVAEEEDASEVHPSVFTKLPLGTKLVSVLPAKLISSLPFSAVLGRWVTRSVVVRGEEFPVEVLLNSVWDAAARAISSGVNNSVDIGRRGITITDSADPLKGIRIVNGAIGISVDGFNTFATAISGPGVIADRLLGRILISNDLYMENDSGTFSFNNTGATLTDASLTINHATLPSRILLNATDGIKIQKDVAGTWTDRFAIDTDGDILFGGKLQGATGVFSGDVTIGTSNNIFKASSAGIQLGHATFGSAPFRVDMNGKLVATGAEISGKIIAGTDSQIGYVYVSGGPPTNADSTSTVIEGGLVTTGTVQVRQGVGSISAGITGATSGDTAVRFWAGSTLANSASAPFRVTQDGKIVATDATITGAINAQSGMFSGNITSSATITGGTLSGATFSGGTINVTTDVNIGRYLNLSGTSFTAGVRLQGTAVQIHHDPGASSLNLTGTGGINMYGATNFNGNDINFTGSAITGLNVVAKFG